VLDISLMLCRRSASLKLDLHFSRDASHAVSCDRATHEQWPANSDKAHGGSNAVEIEGV
jgi:hypothetical protein